MRNKIAELHDKDTASVSVEIRALEWGDIGLCQSRDMDRHLIYLTPRQAQDLHKILSVYLDEKGQSR